MHTVTVPIDFLVANQLIAAIEQRVAYLEDHGGEGVDLAIAQLHKGDRLLRDAFRIPSEAQLDALHEATMADLDDLACADVPLAFAIYQAEGR